MLVVPLFPKKAYTTCVVVLAMFSLAFIHKLELPRGRTFRYSYFSAFTRFSDRIGSGISLPPLSLQCYPRIPITPIDLTMLKSSSHEFGCVAACAEFRQAARQALAKVRAGLVCDA